MMDRYRAERLLRHLRAPENSMFVDSSDGEEESDASDGGAERPRAVRMRRAPPLLAGQQRLDGWVAVAQPAGPTAPVAPPAASGDSTQPAARAAGRRKGRQQKLDGWLAMANQPAAPAAPAPPAAVTQLRVTRAEREAALVGLVSKTKPRGGAAQSDA